MGIMPVNLADQWYIVPVAAVRFFFGGLDLR